MASTGKRPFKVNAHYLRLTEGRSVARRMSPAPVGGDQGNADRQHLSSGHLPDTDVLKPKPFDRVMFALFRRTDAGRFPLSVKLRAPQATGLSARARR
jgi:hypothetical protein